MMHHSPAVHPRDAPGRTRSLREDLRPRGRWAGMVRMTAIGCVVALWLIGQRGKAKVRTRREQIHTVTVWYLTATLISRRQAAFAAWGHFRCLA
jgi:hypothetical protein